MKLNLFAFLIFLTACSSGEVPSDKMSEGLPDGTKQYLVLGQKASVIPIKMQDGTKCVLVIGNGSGRAISCNWATGVENE